MKKLFSPKVLNWIFLNSVLSFCAYYGFIKNVQWTRNIFLFFLWVDFIIKLSHLIPCVLGDVRKRIPVRSVPARLYHIYNFGMLALLASQGKFLFASIFLFNAGMEEVVFSKGGEKQKI